MSVVGKVFVVVSSLLSPPSVRGVSSCAMLVVVIELEVTLAVGYRIQFEDVEGVDVVIRGVVVGEEEVVVGLEVETSTTQSEDGSQFVDDGLVESFDIDDVVDVGVVLNFDDVVVDGPPSVDGGSLC